MATFKMYSVRYVSRCASVCSLGITIFFYMGIFVYMTDYVLSLLRGKYFFPEFYKRINEIDDILKKCQPNVNVKRKSMHLMRILKVTVLVVFILYALKYDIVNEYNFFGSMGFLAAMSMSFPYLASSIVQLQFAYLVAIISERFKKLNFLLEALNKECLKKNLPIKIFDMESDVPKKTNLPLKFQVQDKTELKKISDSENDENTEGEEEDEELQNGNEYPDIDWFCQTVIKISKTSEDCLVDLFHLHDRILTLSRITNHEYGAQTVPYMAVCFVLGLFAIFMETKVNNVVRAYGYVDVVIYTEMIYIFWSVITVVVAYVVLRLCCNANGYSRKSAMVVHEIMQKKPQFMMGNDLFYNKMKSFTLQYLHWEGFFQFNGIGMYALDYTFIFSTVSAATSYLIVLLQFDMTTILRSDGLIP
ncbi:gustatory and pheromone receptor 33a [Episyrphus balteatus]|uniref:gustatory and pheromone receptor 33a n=1 Tax=Episyrphus balteatus TaxID=286459 RepID=UPI0024853B84|nr:gustatory and pheromone receptor 33a [Episyrphus balteatus]